MKQEQNYTIWLWVFVGVVLVGVVAAMVKLASVTNSGTPNPVQTVNILPSVSSSDWIRGNPNASTTLIEYGDFQCPACATFHTVVLSIEKELGDNLRVIFRHFPLQQHANARIAAQAAEAAGKQDKFWEMHDMIYEHQRDWSEKSKTDAIAIFAGYAQKLKLNIDTFGKDINDNAIIDKIEDSFDQGVGFGVDSTPSFFLNNTKLSPRSYGEFRDAIFAAAGMSTSTAATK
ncbi:MAG: thioredoxin domain-containing protein [Patescibacteria group bacterium]